MLIANRTLSREFTPFIIAEMSGNHNQSLERALEIVEAAAKAGAHALKIQTYTADTMTLDLDEGEFFIADPGSLWKGKSLYKLYQEAYTPWEWHKPIFDRCRELGMIGFSTPFDETAVDFLESLDVPCYKIASFENTDIPLIRKVASTGKPMIISTGMATIAELDETVRAAREAGCKDIVLLKCTSTYPATPENTNILTIPHMRDMFNCEIGLSDHTMGIGVSVASIALGATVIEKHFTLRRADGGVDSTFSMEPEEMRSLVVETERAWQALGKISYGPTYGERKSLQYRRSLYVVKDMKVGDVLDRENVRVIRPGFGLSPKYYERILGCRISRDIKKGTAMHWDLIQDESHEYTTPKIVATIEARMTSSRLPGKVLLPVLGRPMLEHLVHRLKNVPSIDEIVLATTINNQDDALVAFAKQQSIGCYRGSEDDVMGRVIGAAESVDADMVVEITGDCPIIDPNLVEQAIRLFLHNDVDYVSNAVIRSYPDGMDVQVFRLETLVKSSKMTNEPLDREHVTLHIRNNPEQFRQLHLVAPPDQHWPELGLTLDEREDYLILKEIIEHFGEKNLLFSCSEAVDLLKKKPELVGINRHVTRKGNT